MPSPAPPPQNSQSSQSSLVDEETELRARLEQVRADIEAGRYFAITKDTKPGEFSEHLRRIDRRSA